MTPEIAREITLQPIRRFGFDAAILFSDILVIPAALGVRVEFEEGFGPRLAAVSHTRDMESQNDKWLSYLAPVYEALRLVRASLDTATALIGFAGAPWTLATYMAEGRGSDDQRAAKLWGYRDPEGFKELLNLLVECVAAHLVAQLEAGADAVQIFDSWAGGLSAPLFEQWVVEPTSRIVEKVRAVRPKAKIIGFPRAATLVGYRRYVEKTGVDAVSIDTAAPMEWAAKQFGNKIALQGNLDPIALIAGGGSLAESVDNILSATANVPFIFNLGHGVLPETPMDHVAKLVAQIRAV